MERSSLGVIPSRRQLRAGDQWGTAFGRLRVIVIGGDRHLWLVSCHKVDW